MTAGRQTLPLTDAAELHWAVCGFRRQNHDYRRSLQTHEKGVRIMRILGRLLRTPPCPKCPYTLRQVFTLRNPCPDCKRNGYATYKLFLRGPAATLRGVPVVRDSADQL